MNRRKFLKRIAAVAAGAVAVPMVARKLPWTSYSVTYKFKPNYIQQGFLSETSHKPKYQVGTLFRAADGRIYRYVQMREEQLKYFRGVYYANNG